MEILNDFSTSVRKALEEISPNYESYRGLVICGTHNQQNVEALIERIRKAREEQTPTLLICAGHQLGFIEYCRNVLGVKDATSEEFGTRGTFVVKKRPELKVGLHEGESWWSNYTPRYELSLLDSVSEIPDYFVSVAYHPEYQSTKEKPHKDLLKFIKLCIIAGHQV